MKKYLICITLLIAFISKAQQRVEISGPASVEVGVVRSYTFTFVPLFSTSTAGTADKYVITEWIVSTGTNGQGGSIPGYINTTNNQSSYYNDSTFNGINPRTIPIQWGDGTFLTSDKINVRVSGYYVNTDTNAIISYFNYLEKELNITVNRINTPNISGPLVIGSCGDQTIGTYSISNFTNADRFSWSIVGGASISGPTDNSSINVIPSSTSNGYFVTCTLRRSQGNPLYVVTKSISVTRAPLVSSAIISGATNICTGTSTYTISNTAGLNVAWSLSNPSIGTTSNPTNSQVNVAFNGNGAQTLTATITNACGQTAIKTFVINTGVTTFTSTATISNPTNVCTGANTFTISGVLSGQSVSWSLSNPSIATLSGSTNSQTVVTFSAIGQQTLTAILTNSCGQTATKTQSFWFGIPGLSSLISPSGFPYSPTNLPLGSDTGSPYWIFTCQSPDATVVSYNITRNGSTFNKPAINRNVTVTSQELGIVAGQSLVVVVTPVNSCGFATRGVSYTLYRPTLCQSGIGVGCALSRMSKPNTAIYTVFPNPSKSIVNIDLKDQNNTPLDRKKISGELFDMVGISKLKIEINNNKATFSVRELNKGIYVLKIYRFSQTETHQIVVK